MANRRQDKMALIAFLQAGSPSVYAGSWRHPATEHGYLDASYYAKIGRQLEEGCFDLMFFDDRLAMPGVYGGAGGVAGHPGGPPGKRHRRRGRCPRGRGAIRPGPGTNDPTRPLRPVRLRPTV